MKKNKTKLSSMDKSLFGYWQAFYLSFYSARLYIDVAKRWKGFGLAYFLLLICIAAIPLSIKTMLVCNRYYDNQLIDPLKKIPDFSVDHGRLVFHGITPYVIKNVYHDAVIVIDPNSTLTEINYVYPHWMLFITSDRFYLHLPKLSMFEDDITPVATINSEDIDMQSFSDIQSETFNVTFWLQQTNLLHLKWYFIVAVYPVFVALLFGFFSVLLVMMTFVGKAFSTTIFKFGLQFKQAYRIMLVSSGCGISLFVLGLPYVTRMPITGFFLLAAIILYFCFAVLAIKRESKSLVLY
ncbi:MAG: hypothetical protein CK424_00365 [Legionella sp.]|nr:MAG: hypothetical protein CK424_00365 [Legionella sp.]